MSTFEAPARLETEFGVLIESNGVFEFSKRPSLGSLITAIPFLLGGAVLALGSILMAILTIYNFIKEPNTFLLMLSLMFAVGLVIAISALLWFQTLVFRATASIDPESGVYSYRCGVVRFRCRIARTSKCRVRAQGNRARDGWACRLQVQARDLAGIWFPLLPAFVVSDEQAFEQIAHDIGDFLMRRSKHRLEFLVVNNSGRQEKAN